MPNLTSQQKLTAKAILSIFETGTVTNVKGYSSVEVLEDGAGITYGIMCTTLMSGNLYLLTKAYVDANGAFSKQFEPYLPQLKSTVYALSNNIALKELYHKAGSDPVMQRTQDDFFERVYWAPAETEANRLKITTPLGMAVVFDGFIQGSFKRIRDLTITVHGTVADIGEKTWIARYVETRRTWLRQYSALLATTVYRMDTFLALIRAENWDLNLPFQVHDQQLTEDRLYGRSTSTTPVKAMPSYKTSSNSGLLKLGDTGEAVTKMQTALSKLGYTVNSTGVFDNTTESEVRKFQAAKKLVVDGVAGQATQSALGL